MSDCKLNTKKIGIIFQRFSDINPKPTTELKYTSVFELLVAVILSAQATDIKVNQVTEKLYAIANTPQMISDLGLQKLECIIQSIGLYRSKAKHIIKTCEILLTKYNGEVPKSREKLELLPGVGRKTANVILNTAFGAYVIAVDTHVFRVSKRIGLASGNNVLEVEKQLMLNIPKLFIQHAHHWLILHGRYICKARKPLCHICPIEDLCHYSQKINN